MSSHTHPSQRAKPAHLPHMAPVLVFLLSLMMSLLAATAAHAQDKPSREREALRRAQQSLRQTQEERDALAGEKAAMSQAKDKAESELKQTSAKVKGAESKAAALRAKADQLEASLQNKDEALNAALQRESELQAQLQKVQAELADKARTLASVASMLTASTQDRQTLLAQNKALYATGLDMVSLLRTQSPSEWQRAKDAMLGLSAVKAENVAEAFRTRLDDANFNAQPAAGAAPAP